MKKINFISKYIKTYFNSSSEELIKNGSSKLNEDVLETIFSFLSPRDFINVSGVCRHWRQAANKKNVVKKIIHGAGQVINKVKCKKIKKPIDIVLHFLEEQRNFFIEGRCKPTVIASLTLNNFLNKTACLHFLSDEKLLLVSYQTVVIHDLEFHKSIAVASFHDQICKIILAPSKSCLGVVLSDNTIGLCFLDRQNLGKIIFLPNKFKNLNIESIGFCPNEKQLIVLSNGRLYFWNFNAPSSTLTFLSAEFQIERFFLSPDSQILATINNFKVCFWDLSQNPPQLLTCKNYPELSVNEFIEKVIFSPNNNRVLLSSNYKLNYLGQISLEERKIYCFKDLSFSDQWFAFSSDGHKIITAGGIYRGWLFWDLSCEPWQKTKISSKYRSLNAHPVLFDNDKKIALAASHVMLIGHLGLELSVFVPFKHAKNDYIAALSISPNGKQIATLTNDGKVRLFDF